MSNYYKKYLKYKNKYLKLQTQIGGSNYDSNFCSEIDKIDLNILKIGDKINFTFPSHAEITNFGFTVVSNPGDINLSEEIRLNSDLLTFNKGPLLSITFNKKENYSKLNFIRTLDETIYKFDLLFSIYGCVTKYFNYPKMKLEDDAMFETNNVNYRALIFRVFTNKDSLYYREPFNFRPTKSSNKEDEYLFNDGDYTDAKYIVDKSLLYNSIIGDFIIYFRLKYKLISADTEHAKTKPYILEQIEKILKSLNDFGPTEYTRDYILRLQDKTIKQGEREIIRDFIDKLFPYKFNNVDLQKEMNTFYSANPLYKAASRIHRSHRDMISSNIICSLCPPSQ
jgi:hypothetical protein